ncbi:adenylosuccinase ade13 [Pseudogymnoascus destructans]|uniref:Adenylosuccinate lyase n=2 Tax=Pseudogymnoascus destructans TaxID=655981 RepID=L8G8D8_PSED2|nr:adenylosuccinase ade13 [Pseudogymnoascus destructans]ELR09500.1 adenylosuccinate lyase [Pseudogymnoascus destructans 20631-21]OAF63029.1 adenylosuccinase ade13 [Pseudogymnoascus destructans]
MADNEAGLKAQIAEMQQKLDQLKATPTSFNYDAYQTSLTGRYCSPEMSKLFSQRSRHSTWRKLWLYLAESEHEIGIETITPEALEQMRAHLELTDADFEVARVEEKKRRHDVMAHVHAFGAVAPAAAGIIHYGATSCYVTDNTELMLMRDGIDLLLPKLAKVIWNLAQFAMQWKAEPTLAYTHLQPAQLITVGKRAAQWAQDLMFDLDNIEHVRNELKFRGAQGTTGTQASFMEIFGDDTAKCDKLNELLCKKTGFSECYDVSTQTYTRKVDLIVANAIAGLGSTAQKIAGDIRHLATFKEIEEPFEKDQIGSSAMSYKRNPMRSERIYSLARELMSKPASFAATHSDQWMERSLDDSAIRRMDIPETFLLADAILIGLDNVSNGLVVYPNRVNARVQEELPFMITESIIMKLVALGESRQEAHEQIRVLSHQAGRSVKNDGKPNDLVARIKATEFFKPIWVGLDDMLKAELYTGRSVEIVERFCAEGGVLDKKIKPYKAFIEKATTAELNV